MCILVSCFKWFCVQTLEKNPTQQKTESWKITGVQLWMLSVQDFKKCTTTGFLPGFFSSDAHTDSTQDKRVEISNSPWCVFEWERVDCNFLFYSVLFVNVCARQGIDMWTHIKQNCICFYLDKTHTFFTGCANKLIAIQYNFSTRTKYTAFFSLFGV